MVTTTELDKIVKENTAEIAVYHHYLMEAFLEKLPDGESIGDIFGEGEDSVVINLFPYSAIYWKLVDESYICYGGLPGVAVYELSEELADIMWSEVSEEGYPSRDNFIDKASIAIKQWQIKSLQK